MALKISHEYWGIQKVMYMPRAGCVFKKNNWEDPKLLP